MVALHPHTGGPDRGAPFDAAPADPYQADPLWPDDDDLDPAPARGSLFARLRIAALAVLVLALVGGGAYAARGLIGGSPAKAPASGTAASQPATGQPSADYGAPAADPATEPSTDPATGPATGTAQQPPASAAAPPKASAKPAPGGPAGPLGEVFRLVNVERARAGCPALAAEPRLAAAAGAHSADMAAKHYFSHTSQDGSSLALRIDRTGYKWSRIGENIAKGQSTPAAVMTAWMNSPGHRANILNCQFRHLGVGLAFDGKAPVWTQDFATPR
jgi:uncharacterized protein YkwD